MNRLKLRVTAICVAAMILTVLSQGSYAFYTTASKATSVVTSGSIVFAIHEQNNIGNPHPSGVMYISPGDTVSKEVTVENICEHPFYLRAKPVYGPIGGGIDANDCVWVDINFEDWVWHYDGWYYYQGVLEPGEVSGKLFSHVNFSGEAMDNTYLGKTLTLSVRAQAVQSEHNPITDGQYFTAKGWPEDDGWRD